MGAMIFAGGALLQQCLPLMIVLLEEKYGECSVSQALLMGGPFIGLADDLIILVNQQDIGMGHGKWPLFFMDL